MLDSEVSDPEDLQLSQKRQLFVNEKSLSLIKTNVTLDDDINQGEHHAVKEEMMESSSFEFCLRLDSSEAFTQMTVPSLMGIQTFKKPNSL